MAREAWMLGINPGGEVLGATPPGDPPGRFRNRLLLGRDEASALGDMNWPWPDEAVV